jgi:5'(3')-deoxyribonucleotidase
MATDEMRKPSGQFVLGVDLDGVCADFYGKMREVTAEWLGVEPDSLDPDVEFGLAKWGVRQKQGNDPGEYDRIHRFAVTQRRLFEDVQPIPGAAQSIRRLGTEGIRIRVITHRLFIRWFHEIAVAQTVRWLDNHAIPYWDLCFMRDKESVDADLYVDDGPSNIEALRAAGKGANVIIFDNSTNRHIREEPGLRARDWTHAEEIIRSRYYTWLRDQGCSPPAEPGRRPPWDNDPRD